MSHDNPTIERGFLWVGGIGYFPEYVGGGIDDNIIQGYLIDDELIRMVVECIHPTAVGGGIDDSIIQGCLIDDALIIMAV
jgi:hypothetical protein